MKVTVKGKVRGLKVGAVPSSACGGLAALLTRPLRSAGLAKGDLRALAAAAAGKACGKPFSQAVLDRLGLGAPPPTSGGLVTPGGNRPSPPPTATVALGARTLTDPTCGPVTVAVTLADGGVAALRDDWC